MSLDHAGFEALFVAHHDAVARYAVRRVGRDLAQDVVAETFAVVWRKRAELDGDPLPWLFGIARRVAANQLRGANRRMALGRRLRQQPRGESVDLDAGVEMPLLSALRGLSARDREALMLVAWEQLDHRGAAKAMGCSTAAFSVRLHRARRRLARALEADTQTSLPHERALAHEP